MMTKLNPCEFRRRPVTLSVCADIEMLYLVFIKLDLRLFTQKTNFIGTTMLFLDIDM